MAPSPLIERTHHPAAATIKEVRVDHRPPDVAMTEKFLNRTDIRTRLEQVSGKRVVPQGMAAGGLADAGAPDRLFHRALQHRLVKVAPAVLPVTSSR